MRYEKKKKIKNLLEKNILVSPITLKNYLPDDKDNIDNVKYLQQIKDSAPSTQNSYNYGHGGSSEVVGPSPGETGNSKFQDLNSDTNDIGNGTVQNLPIFTLSWCGEESKYYYKPCE